MTNMQHVILKLWLVMLNIITTLSNSTLHQQLVASKIARDDINPDFISIDCGATEDYIDINTGIWYQPDSDFVKTGTNYALKPGANIDNPYFGTQLSTLRSFPEGKKNCYTMKPKPGKNSGFLIRAFFSYGNYDNKNQPPTFDLYVGIYYWDTIPILGLQEYYYTEINYAPSTDIITVCLVNTDQGLPFISSLELRTLNNSIYQILPISLPQYLQGRYDIGINSTFRHNRYKDDVYDRIWNNNDIGSTTSINGTADVHKQNRNDAYNLPAQVLTTAVQPLSVSNTIDFYYSYDYGYQYYVYLHFFEFEQLHQGQKRVINVTVDNDYTHSVSITLQYLKALTISLNHTTNGYANISISSEAESDLPPILNALEIYRITPQSNSPTDTGDVNAILEIKQIYEISRIDWQGDPCAPLAWTGLICSSSNFPRIISVNLSSSNLSGEIASSFYNLTRLEHLDLSNNEFTGLLPEFIAYLPNLKTIDLSGNKLTGPLPKALMEKLKSKTLDLSVDGNPGLCLRGSCKKRKFVIPLVSSIAAVVIIAFFSLMIWRHKRKRPGDEGSLQIKARAYSYPEILRVTNNFKTIIGEGGFGKVYLGAQHDGTQVAVKLLTLLSKQGYKAYQSEVELLTFLHHSNLICLVGYCNKGDVKALIYEYMDNGNLHQKLSEKNPNILKWIERLHIAVDAAQGLDYLHNGCSPPIIHRDLKTTNILLNARMQAKVADFGLSRALASDNDSQLLTSPAGTPGYLDPQHRITKKSDIYSFGIILFELITGQPAIKQNSNGAIQMRHWVIPEIERGDVQNIIDKRLKAKFSIASIHKAINIATSCISISAVQRPDISHVLAELKECLALETTSLSIQFESQITEIYPRLKHQHLLTEKNPNVLKWIERLHIAVDAAQGLDYLHNRCRPPIIHRDLKTSNILLNARMQAKIADFGLSRAFANDNDNLLITSLAGTPGYLDPQFPISKKSDIYSFGIILFELITGQPAIKQTSEGVIHMYQWVIPEIQKGDVQNIIDKSLEAKFSIDSVQKVINIATSCISVSGVQRPDISNVLVELRECLALEMESTSGMNSIQFELQIIEIYPR